MDFIFGGTSLRPALSYSPPSRPKSHTIDEFSLCSKWRHTLRRNTSFHSTFKALIEPVNPTQSSVAFFLSRIICLKTEWHPRYRWQSTKSDPRCQTVSSRFSLNFIVDSSDLDQVRFIPWPYQRGKKWENQDMSSIWRVRVLTIPKKSFKQPICDRNLDFFQRGQYSSAN